MAKQDSKPEVEQEAVIIHKTPAVRMKAPENCNGIHHEGEFYETKDGHVVVPHHVARVALAHGFKHVK